MNKIKPMIFFIIFFFIYCFMQSVFADENYKFVLPRHDNYIVCTNENKYGLLNLEKQITIEPIYDKIEDVGANYIKQSGKSAYKKIIYVIKQNDKYGIADTNGKILYEPQFDYISRVGYNNMVQSRFAEVKKDDKYALYDIYKKEMSDFIFDNIAVSHDEIQITVNGEKYLLHPYKSKIKTICCILLLPVTIPLTTVVILLAMLSLL